MPFSRKNPEASGMGATEDRSSNQRAVRYLAANAAVLGCLGFGLPWVWAALGLGLVLMADHSSFCRHSDPLTSLVIFTVASLTALVHHSRSLGGHGLVHRRF